MPILRAGRPSGLEVEPSVEVGQLKVTGKRRVERMQRVSQMLSLRLHGCTLSQIADAQTPPISFQAVSKGDQGRVARHHDRTPRTNPQLGGGEARRDHGGRPVREGAGWYEKALAGDIAAIDRVLAIMHRRSRLLGLDIQPGGALRFGDRGPYEEDQPTVRVELINNPGIDRMRWLEEELERLLGLTQGVTTTSGRSG